MLKVKHSISQPSIQLPAMFSKIAALQKDYYSGKHTRDFCPALPAGTVTYGEKRVRSAEITFPGVMGTCYINGRFDIVATLDDGSFAVLDFKTGSPKDEKTGMYARQLHSYALALENAAPEGLHLTPVSRLGLLYFIPDGCEQISITRQRLEGELIWVPVTRDDASFNQFLRDVVVLLDGPLPQPQPENCNWCKFRSQTRGIDHPAADRANGIASVPMVPDCPQCGSPMRLRTGKYGEFWSCLKYPDCKGTRNP